MKFALTIDLGNAAMDEPADLADALRNVAAYLDTVYGISPPARKAILDANGNTVGEWKVV